MAPGLAWAAGVLLLLLACPAAAQENLAARRVAVVVGANAAVPGRPSLRYAHDDAERFAQTLAAVASFRPTDIDLLLDEAPSAILAALDRRLAELRDTAGQTLLLFYFSGHADSHALYSGGAPLPLDELKARLADPAASVRVGIVDACSGGAWTGTKGLRPAEDFTVDLPAALASEGSALLSASSGLGEAHESSAIGGSFFTHHLIAGLRGAADRSGDGRVTLHEAFDYAQPLTVRDSALVAGLPQRPSFRIHLHGRGDLVLSRVGGTPNRLSIVQETGPLQVIRLDRGLVVLEIPAGPHRIVAALPPGRYLLRRRDGDGTWAREVDLGAGERLEVRERDLELYGGGALAAKGAPPPPASTLPGGHWALQLAMGRVLSGAAYTGDADAELGGVVDLRVGLTDRVELSPIRLGAAWRLGEPGALEVILHGDGAWGVLDGSFYSLPTFGAEARLHAGSGGSLLAGARATTAWGNVGGHAQAFDHWTFAVNAGWIQRVGARVTLSAGAGLGNAWDQDLRDRVGLWRPAGSAFVELGSVLRIGSAPLPIASVRLFDWLRADGYATVRLDLDGGVVESFMGGATVRF